MSNTKKVRSERIRRHRLDAGLTMADLGKRIGVAIQTIQKYEEGIIDNIPLDKIEKMAATLNVAPAYIAGWTDDPTYKPKNEDVFKTEFAKLSEEKQRFIIQSMIGLRSEE